MKQLSTLTKSSYYWRRFASQMGLLVLLISSFTAPARAATADVVATIQGQPVIASGAAATYTVTVVNNGPDAATGLAVVVHLPRALNNVTGGNYDFNSGLLTVALPSTSLATGAKQQLPIRFTAPGNTQSLVSTVTCTATSSDPNASNNDGSGRAASLATTVTLPLSGCGVDYNGRPSVQGLYAEYFKGATTSFFTGDPGYFTGKSPNLVRTDADLNLHNHDPYSGTGTSNWGDLITTVSNTVSQPEYFSVRERGYITIEEAGSYVFSVAMDDALGIWLDDAARATPLAPSAAVPINGYTSIYLSAGVHPMQVLYGQGPVNSFLVISYKGPDTNNQFTPIPNKVLCSAQIVPSPTPQPVELLSFEAQEHDHGALLTWETLEELSIDHFDIERSLDGINFTKIAETAAHGTTALTHDYSYLDAGASKVGRLVYYRLRQVAATGDVVYSPVRSVALTPVLAVELYPNPLPIGEGDLLHIEATGAGTQAIYRIYDSSGAALITKEAPTAVPLTLDVHELPSGLYLLRVQTDAAERITESFVRR